MAFALKARRHRKHTLDDTPHMIDPIHHCVLFIPFGQVFPCGHMNNYDPMVTVIYLHLWWSCILLSTGVWGALKSISDHLNLVSRWRRGGAQIKFSEEKWDIFEILKRRQSWQCYQIYIFKVQRNEISWYFVLAPPKRGIDFLLSHHYQGSDGFNTDCHKEMHFLLHPLGWTNGSTVTLPWVGMYRFVHPLRPQYFPQPSRCPLGHLCSPDECIQHLTSFGWSTSILSSLIHPQGCIKNYLPPGQLV